MRLARLYYGLKYRIGSKLHAFAIGTHPHNKFGAFNWHNVRHITSFYSRVTESWDSTDLVIADIGGGRSPYYEYFATSAAQFVVVDLRASLPQQEQRPIEQIDGDAENLPLRDQSVDVVLCNQVLEHVRDPIRAVAEIGRILKPGGRFLGSVPQASPIHLEPYDYRRFTRYGIEQLLRDAGFSQMSIEGNGGVFSTAALLISMDVLLSKHSVGHSQEFNYDRALLLSPFIGCLNLLALALDKSVGDRERTPANLCWEALKGL